MLLPTLAALAACAVDDATVATPRADADGDAAVACIPADTDPCPQVQHVLVLVHIARAGPCRALALCLAPHLTRCLLRAHRTTHVSVAFVRQTLGEAREVVSSPWFAECQRELTQVVARAHPATVSSCSSGGAGGPGVVVVVVDSVVAGHCHHLVQSGREVDPGAAVVGVTVGREDGGVDPGAWLASALTPSTPRYVTVCVTVC